MEHQPDPWEVEKREILQRGYEPSDRALHGAVKGYTGCSLTRGTELCPCERREQEALQ